MKSIEDNFNDMRPSVDFVGIIKENGRIETTLFKNKITLTDEKMEMFCMGITLQHSMQKDFDNEFGLMNYTVTERQNMKIVSMPVFRRLLVVLMNKNQDHYRVILKIKSILGLKESSVSQSADLISTTKLFKTAVS